MSQEQKDIFEHNERVMRRIFAISQENFEKRDRLDLLLTPNERKLLQYIQILKIRLEMIAADDSPQEHAQECADYCESIINDMLPRRSNV